MFGDWMGEDAIKIYEGGQTMTKEQAIQELERFNREGRIFATSVHEAIETVLSMLKEKDKEIEEYKRMIAAGIINTAKDELVQQKNKEIEKKDKQINYMANFINDNTPYTKDTKELENEEGIRTANFTTKYFERKSK